MEPRTAAAGLDDPEAVEFVRFCYQRRRAGWPEIYDEMCAVANRGLFRGYGVDDLAAHGIGFSLFHMPALATLACRVVGEEKARRRPVSVVISDAVDVDGSDHGPDDNEAVSAADRRMGLAIAVGA